MNNIEFINNIKQTYDKGVDIIRKKNSDYANSLNPFKNFESAEIVGVSVEKAILVRMLDKLSRISNIIDKGGVSVKDESVEDTLIDLINYTAILKAYRERNKHEVS